MLRTIGAWGLRGMPLVVALRRPDTSWASSSRGNAVSSPERDADVRLVPAARSALLRQLQQDRSNICWDRAAIIPVVGAFSFCWASHSQNHRCITPVYRERCKNLKPFNRLLIFHGKEWCCQTGLNRPTRAPCFITSDGRMPDVGGSGDLDATHPLIGPVLEIAYC